MKKPVLIILLSISNIVLYAQEVIPLYDKVIPNSKPVKDEEVTEVQSAKRIIIAKVTRPTLTAYLPSSNANGTAIIICPGGGYSRLAAGHEGVEVAKAFNAMGIAAFVLKYRIPNDSSMINKAIGPLQDAQRAIQLVRQRAKEWNVNVNRVGIMGFSAGGHLASMAGTHFSKPVTENANNTNLRPDFMVLLYPVISFNESTAHIGSRNQLIGKNPASEMIRLYSNELQVTPQTPPTFLVHAGDDNGVKVQNSIDFYMALQKNNVPAEMHIYPKGGHGFGMDNATTPDKWMDRLKNWMEMNGWLKK